MTPDELRQLLNDERDTNHRRGASDLTLADCLDEDDKQGRLFGGLI